MALRCLALAFVIVAVLAPAALATYPEGGTCATCPSPTQGIDYKPPVIRPTSCASIRPSGTSCPPWNVPYGMCCGTEGYPRCGGISCSYAFAYSSSGPGQCSKSYAVIAAAAISNTTWKAVSTYTTDIVEDFCLSDAPTYGSLVKTAVALASVYAEATATTLIYHNQYICYNQFNKDRCAGCTDCPGTARSIVGAKAQSVAVAAGEAWATAVAGIKFEGEDYYLSQAQAESGAIASAVNIAYDEFTKTLDSATMPTWANTPGKCAGSGPATKCKQAVAQALVCVFAKALAKVYQVPAEEHCDPEDPAACNTQGTPIDTPDQTSCANAYSASYSIDNTLYDLQCPGILCPARLPCKDSGCSDGQEYPVPEAGCPGVGTTYGPLPAVVVQSNIVGSLVKWIDGGGMYIKKVETISIFGLVIDQLKITYANCAGVETVVKHGNTAITTGIKKAKYEAENGQVITGITTTRSSITGTLATIKFSTNTGMDSDMLGAVNLGFTTEFLRPKGADNFPYDTTGFFGFESQRKICLLPNLFCTTYKQVDAVGIFAAPSAAL